MKLIDRAKKALGEGFGDETVRVVNYDAEVEEVEVTPKAKPAPKVKEPRAPRAPKPARAPKPPGGIKPKPTPPVKPKPAPKAEESSWDLDEAIEYEHETHVQADPRKDEEKIQDVLEVLDIKTTFAIEKDIFLPEDLEDITFDYQAPYGFDQGQVLAFIESTKNTVERYVSLLKIRNGDVAKLASVVDRLQVDYNNLKFQTEINHGINVMPTSDSEDLESKYMEAKLRIKRLEDIIRTHEQGDELTSEERKRFDDLQDEYSILRRENEAFVDEVYELKNRLAYLEEEADNAGVSTPVTHEESIFELPDEIDAYTPTPTPPRKPSGSASVFLIEDDEDNDSSNDVFIEILDDNMSTSNGSDFFMEDEDDDELEKMMQEWNR